MKIGYCKDDIMVLLLGVLPLSFAAAILCGYEMGWSISSLIVCSSMLLLTCLLIAPNILYFSRTILLAKDGVTISIWKYQKYYLWSDLTVNYCQNDHGICIDDWAKPGLLITAIPFRKASIFTAQPACIYTHPMRSVFLRFQSDDTSYLTGKLVHTGYVIEKEALLEFLRDSHVSIHEPDKTI